MEKKQAIELFRDYLKKEKNRITPERFEVLDAALEYDGHFGADDLFILMKNKKSQVSRATVYNTLELLEECQLLSKRNFGGNINRYESLVEKSKHDHLVCLKCGKIIEFSTSKITSIPQDICDENDFELTGYSFIVFGRCNNPECKSKDKSENVLAH